jgi:hypothetical protein
LQPAPGMTLPLAAVVLASHLWVGATPGLGIAGYEHPITERVWFEVDVGGYASESNGAVGYQALVEPLLRFYADDAFIEGGLIVSATHVPQSVINTTSYGVGARLGLGFAHAFEAGPAVRVSVGPEITHSWGDDPPPVGALVGGLSSSFGAPSTAISLRPSIAVGWTF